MKSITISEREIMFIVLLREINFAERLMASDANDFDYIELLMDVKPFVIDATRCTISDLYAKYPELRAVENSAK